MKSSMNQSNETDHLLDFASSHFKGLQLTDLTEEVLRALMDVLGDVVFYIKDRDHRMVMMNRRGLENLGLHSNDQVVGRSDREIFGDEFGKRTEVIENRLFSRGEAIVGEVEYRRSEDGTETWTSTTKMPLSNDKGEVVGLIGITRLINDVKLREERLEYQATHDVLTNTLNRNGLADRIKELIQEKEDRAMAVLEIDLDNFASVNDAFGHLTGDEFLRWFGWVMRSTVEPEDLVARMGGDEFVIILHDKDTIEEIGQVCSALISNFHERLDPRYQEMNLGISIGISLYPLNSENPVELIKQADDALYWVKRGGKNHYRYYSKDGEAKSLPA